MLAAVPTCLVMEFVPGVSLKGLAITALFDPPAAAARCERVFGPRGELSPPLPIAPHSSASSHALPSLRVRCLAAIHLPYLQSLESSVGSLPWVVR